MKISNECLLLVLSAHILLVGVDAWSSSVYPSHPPQHLHRSMTRRLVTSRDVEDPPTQQQQQQQQQLEADTKTSVPYVIARGDGSTGGGGLPMPHQADHEGLARPKVGAEMPKG